MIQHPVYQCEFENFLLPFAGKLSKQNRWVKLAELVPWERVQQYYDESLSHCQGAPSLTARVAFGALLIKERLGLTDREVVEQIQENPYLQYFLGFTAFKPEAPFDASLMVHFRKRFSQQALQAINEAIIKRAQNTNTNNESDSDSTSQQHEAKTTQQPELPDIAQEEPKPQGKLLIDATVAPADITHPTDLGLLNHAREVTELCIDSLFAPLRGKERKPRTYRRNAHRAYLSIIKQKRPGLKKIRKAIGQQLRFLRRNLNTLDELVQREGISYRLLSDYRYKQLMVISEVYRQQLYMYENNVRKIADRIVNLSQPHVRAIVRGKSAAKVEFGAKLSVSYSAGYCQVERLSWDAYHEAADLPGQVESYKARYGYYPQVVCADKIYRTATNRRYCQDKGIRLSGRGPGRPSVQAEVVSAQRKQVSEDERSRIAIEGKFGQAKRRFSLGRVMSKLASTSVSSILITFITMNLMKCIFAFLIFLRQRGQALLTEIDALADGLGNVSNDGRVIGLRIAPAV